MTKYANTPAGRAAAAADMAATGTTMGRRPTGPKGPMVRPGVPSGPKIGVRPADPKPANPRVTYGPRGVAPYDDTPTATRAPSGSGKTKFPLDSNGNYIIPPGTVSSVSFSRPAPPQQVGLSAPQQPVGGPRGKLPWVAPRLASGQQLNRLAFPPLKRPCLPCPQPTSRYLRD